MASISSSSTDNNNTGFPARQQQNIGDPQPWYEIDIVITNLFQHFNGKEILACHLVNKTWARLLFNVNNDKIQRWKWKMLLKETWPQFNVNVNETSGRSTS